MSTNASAVRRLNGCAATALLILSALLSGCDRGSSDPGPVVIAPDLVQYSDKVKQRAADELEAIEAPPCARTQTDGDLSGCSALKVFIPDYLRTRDDIRALRQQESEHDGS